MSDSSVWTGSDGLLAAAARRARRYVDGVDRRAVAPTAAALAGLERFGEPLPEHPSDPMETLALLDDAGSGATVASTGPRYFGFVTGGTLPIALASAWLGAAWDQNTALPVMSPVAARLHEVTRDWLVQLLGLPDTTEAAFVTGATMANATALAAARDHLLAGLGWDVPQQGLFGAPELTVVVGEKVHSTLLKALTLIGLGRNRVHRVPVDDQGRLRADLLPDVDGPVIVCAQAGEVNTGAFDPFPQIVSWARERDAWVHVDGAFGLWALADPSRRHLVAGLTEADSWATDAHKWLNVTYDSGIVFVADPEHLRRSFASVAGYLPPGGGYEAMHHTPQSSQRARQIEVWAVLRSLGRAGVAELVANGCRQAGRIGDALATAGLDVLNDVVLNQVLVATADDEATDRLIAAVQADGTCWCGPTTWRGRAAMRLSVSGWNTTEQDADRSVEAILRCARQVAALPPEAQLTGGRPEPGPAATSGIRLLLVSGSTRQGSTNTAALRTAEAGPPAGVTAVLFDRLADLPAFSPDDDRDPLPEPVVDLRRQIDGADAVLFCTPEYAGALPGSFKNLLDWTVGGTEIYQKPVAWINVAAEGRGANADASLATVLGYVGAVAVEAACVRLPVPRQAVGPDGLVADADLRGRMTQVLQALARAVRPD